MFLDSACSCLRPIYWSQVFSGEWRCSWSSADRRCSNYVWVISNFIAYSSASYIRDLTVESLIRWYFNRIVVILQQKVEQIVISWTGLRNAYGDNLTKLNWMEIKRTVWLSRSSKICLYSCFTKPLSVTTQFSRWTIPKCYGECASMVWMYMKLWFSRCVFS